MNILLIVVVAVLAVSAVIGKKKGFIKMVFSMFSLIVALLLTAFISPVVAGQLQENEKVVGYFADKAEDILPFEEAGEKINSGAQSVQENFLNDLPLPESIKKSLLENNNKDYYSALGVKSFEEYICNYIACMIISALSFVLTFLVIFILLQVLCFSLDLISKLPVLNGANHLLGMAVGVLDALILIWIFFIAVTAIGGTSAGSSLLRMISESKLLTFLYDNNLLLGKVIDLTKLL